MRIEHTFFANSNSVPADNEYVFGKYIGKKREQTEFFHSIFNEEYIWKIYNPKWQKHWKIEISAQK